MLYLIRGLPGSGKSTFAKTYFPGLFHIENDMAHMTKDCKYIFNPSRRNISMDWAHEMVRLTLDAHINCVISNVFVSVPSINSYKDIADEFNSDFKVIRLVSQFRNVHDVPKEVFESMKKSFEDYPNEIIIDLSKDNVPEILPMLWN